MGDLEPLDWQRFPVSVTEIAEEASSFRTEPRVLGIMRQNECEVTGLCDHGMGTIRFALIRPGVGVGVNVGNNLETEITAAFP